MPRPDDPNHKRLERDVITFCSQCQIRTFAIPYHDIVDEPIKTLLANNQTLAANIVRTRADRHGIHEPTGLVFRWDAKTSRWSDDSDFGIEALPVLAAMMDYQTYGIHHVFCCRRVASGKDIGISAHTLIQQGTQRIQRIMFPQWRWRDNVEHPVWSSRFRNWIELLGIQTDIIHGECLQGSGDPVMAIHTNSCINHQELPSWQQCLIDLIS